MGPQSQLVLEPPKYEEVVQYRSWPPPAAQIYVYRPPEPLSSLLALETIVARPDMAMESELLKYIGMFEPQALVRNPEEADFFLIPHTLIAHWVGCYKTKVSVQLGTCDFNRTTFNPMWYWKNALRPFFEHVVFDQPYFNSSRGRDHLFIYTCANGPFCDNTHLVRNNFGGVFLDDSFFKWVVQQMMVIGSHGSVMQLPDGPVMTALSPRHLHSPFRQQCFSPGFDITLPQYDPRYTNSAGTEELDRCNNGRCESWLKFLVAKAASVRHVFYFLGTTDQILPWCAPGVRRYVGNFCNPSNNCTDQRYGGIFALAPAGNACWSTRFFDAIDNLAIPVIMADPIVEPFEQFVAYERFVFKVNAHALVTNEEALAWPVLMRKAEEFWRLCAAGNAFRCPRECFNSSVSTYLAALVAVRPWLTTPQGITRLFLAELDCRSKHPAKICNASKSARLASMQELLT